MTEISFFLKPGAECSLQLASLTQHYGVQRVTNPAQAEWIVVPRLRSVLPYLARYPFKKYLVYTKEPRHSNSCSRQKTLVPGLRPVEIMSVFTGDVFWHHYHYLGSCHYNLEGALGVDIYHELPMLTSRETDPAVRPVAAFISYRLDQDTRWVVGGIDRDLEVPRARYSQALHEAGLCDIFGSGWPAGVSKESSGYMTEMEKKVPWWTRKMEELANYRYNLCLENSAADYYCTEKIWQAIQAGTLPIFWGPNNKIYDLFPRHSFIDMADFKTPAELADFLRALPEKDYLERNNQCRAVFNRCIAERRDTIAEDAALHMERIMARLRS